jgi:hypothetical protein
VHDGKREARVHPTPIDQHGAGSTLTVITALLRTGEPETLTERIEQRDPRLDLEPVDGTVDAELHRECLGASLVLR